MEFMPFHAFGLAWMAKRLAILDHCVLDNLCMAFV